MPETFSLLEKINQFVEKENFELPVFNDVAIRVLKIAQQEHFDIKEMSQLIYQDQVLVAEVLKAANSPFFGGLTKITTIKDAVIRLGASQVSNLVLMASERSKYAAKNKKFKNLFNKLWKHAVACAIGAQWLAKKLNYHEKDNEAFIGGLLHDIGKLFLLRVLDTMQSDPKTALEISEDLTHELLDSFHPLQGFKLLNQWNIPELYCQIARDHHNEEIDQNNIPLIMVRLTDQALIKLGIGIRHDPSIVLVSTAEAMILRVKEITLAELEVMLEDTLQIATA
ncbi:MAG: HDOD domain-containing protein [Desulfobulbaceae bacterium]|nr:HDOD domain-containing protein [Desulfobulbaceae bacterium]